MNQLEKTKQLMGALVRMKPKPHEDMKVGGSPKQSSSKKKKKKIMKRSEI